MKDNKIKPLTHLLLILFAVCCTLPILLMISLSFTSEKEYFETGVKLIPNMPTLDSYKTLFRYPERIINAYGVTIFITVVGTSLNLLISSMIAYSLSRNNYKYRNVISFMLYFTMLFSGGLVPFYILITQYLHLKDNILVLILPGLGSPMTIFLLRTYFRSVPDTLFEAAKIDGASEFRMFITILLPLSLPGLASVGLSLFLAYWNEWYNALLFIDKKELYPLQLMLQNISEWINQVRLMQTSGMGASAGVNATALNVPTKGVQAATALIVAGPVLFIFLFFQKYFVSGITLGGVKE